MTSITQTTTALIVPAREGQLVVARSTRAWAISAEPAKPPRQETPSTVSIATGRWLGTKDRRGGTDTKPIVYGAAELAFFAEHGIGRRGDIRPKTREIYGRDNVFDDGSIDIGWASKVVHRRWKRRIEQYSEAGYRYLSRWARSIQFDRNEWRQKTSSLRQPKSSRRFSPNADLLTAEARQRWWVDRELARMTSRAERYASTLWNSRLVHADEGSGWASGMGVKKADTLLAVKLGRRCAEANVERYLKRHITPVDAALAALEGAVRHMLTRPLVFNSPEYRSSLLSYLVVDLARREPKAFAALAEIEADGGAEIRQSVVDALERAMERQGGFGGGPTFAADLRTVLRGRPGDGQRVLEAAAASASGVRPATYRKNLAEGARQMSVTIK